MRRHYGQRRNAGFARCKNHYSRFKDRIDVITSATGIYRSRRGIFMGVCRGVAEYFNFSVFWLRIIVFLLFLFTGFWPIGVLYIIAGLLLKMEPVIPLENETDQEFYQSYTNSRESAIQRIKRKFDNIDRRIQRMEHTVTSREFEL
jgi:phage shock protein C